jgi:hypothetical protein
MEQVALCSCRYPRFTPSQAPEALTVVGEFFRVDGFGIKVIEDAFFDQELEVSRAVTGRKVIQVSTDENVRASHSSSSSA